MGKLPAILDIAEEYGVDIDPKTIDKKETMAICPFCNSSNHKLSINAEKNVFKCWVCAERGGVLAFEAKLSGKGFNQIKAKYFGTKSNIKKKHPAYELTPDQLKQIGFHKMKQKEFNVFNKNKDEVIRSWKNYEYEEYVKYYAIFLLISSFNNRELQKTQYEWFVEEIKKSKVENILQEILDVYRNKLQRPWVFRAIEVSEIAYELCIKEHKENNVDLYASVLFSIELMKNIRRKGN